MFSERVCVYGSRRYTFPALVAEAVMALEPDVIVVTGGAAGVDAWAYWVAATVCRCWRTCRHVEGDPEFRNLQTEVFPVAPVEWRRLGRKAGPLRNARMEAVSHRGLGFWDGFSRGTLDMTKRFIRSKKRVNVAVRDDLMVKR